MNKDNRMDNSYVKTALVIGNGFDLDLKLKTKYSDFAESKEWKELFAQTEIIKKTPLLQYLYGKRFIDQWFDIEKALYDYALIKIDGSFAHTLESDKEGYRLICEALGNYLRNHVYNQSHPIDDTVAGIILKSLCGINSFIDNRIYSFNYTPIDLYMKVLGQETCMPQINYIHGDIVTNSIILGIENVDIRKISSGYSFLYKSNNTYYKSTEICSDLQNAKTVIIFGHSLNEFDFVYFEEYFKKIIDMGENRKLYIVTYDERSKNSILDNIREQGFSVVSLFQHTQICFILTSSLKDENSENYKKYAELKESI